LWTRQRKFSIRRDLVTDGVLSPTRSSNRRGRVADEVQSPTRSSIRPGRVADERVRWGWSEIQKRCTENIVNNHACIRNMYVKTWPTCEKLNMVNIVPTHMVRIIKHLLKHLHCQHISSNNCQTSIKTIAKHRTKPWSTIA
jgi:hypothetical protein